MEAEKIALTDLLYSTLEIYNILVCNTNLLPIYIHSIKICGGYMHYARENSFFGIFITHSTTISILRAHLRAKDVLYLMARLFHMLGKCHDRNQVSAELKRLEDQYTTNGASQLAIML